MSARYGDAGGHSETEATGQPTTPAQQSLKGDDRLRGRVVAKNYELSERKHKNRFRWIMLFALPVLTTLWLGMIAFTILTDRITGIPVGIALGATGAGLLTLLGLQIGWAYSRKNGAGPSLSGRVLKSFTKAVGE